MPTLTMSTSSSNLPGSTIDDLEIYQQTPQHHYQQQGERNMNLDDENDFASSTTTTTITASSSSLSLHVPTCMPSHASTSRSRSLKTKTSKKHSKWWSGLLWGQGIAFFATSTNASSSFEYKLGIKSPILFLFFAYVVLTILNLRPKLQKGLDTDKKECTSYKHNLPLLNIKLLFPWYNYLCLSALDVLPNYMTLLALKYTSLPNTSLLGTLTVPSAMIVSRILLRKLYTLNHYLGVGCTLGGALLIIFSDYNNNNKNSTASDIAEVSTRHYPYSHLGDLFAVMAALLYGTQDAIGEYWIKSINGDINEYLGLLGLFGALWASMLLLLDGKEILNVISTTHIESLLPILFTMIWYVTSVVLFYQCTAYFLIYHDATLLILSLQATPLWSLLFARLVYNDTPSQLFYIALILIVAGVFYYELVGNYCGNDVCKAGDERDTINERSHLLQLNASSDDCYSNSSTEVDSSEEEESEDDDIEEENNNNSKHSYGCYYYGPTTNHELVDI